MYDAVSKFVRFKLYDNYKLTNQNKHFPETHHAEKFITLIFEVGFHDEIF